MKKARLYLIVFTIIFACLMIYAAVIDKETKTDAELQTTATDNNNDEVTNESAKDCSYAVNNFINTDNADDLVTTEKTSNTFLIDNKLDGEKSNGTLREYEENIKAVIVSIKHEKKREAEQKEELNTENLAQTQAEIKPIKRNNALKNAPLLNKLKGQLTTHILNFGHVNSPKGVAFNFDATEIWVTSLMNSRSGVTVFSVVSGDRIKDIHLDGYGGVEVIFSKDGKYAYVSQMETGRIFEIDANTKKITRIFNTESVWTKVMDISADGKTLFTSNWSGADVSEIDLTTGELRRRIPVVKTPRGIYATEDGKTLYVAGFSKGEIQKIDLLTGDKRVIFKSGRAMRHIVADEERGVLFISDMGKRVIFKVDMKTDEVTVLAKTDANPNTIALTPDKRVLIVSCRGKNNLDSYYRPGPEWGSILLFDTQTGKMLDAIVAGNQPTALDISSDGRLLVFSDFLDARLKLYKIPSYDVLLGGEGGRSNYYKADLGK
ncbi:MAG: hypothetical protein COA82_01680 [Alkaliphilus sp.]|nr:YncE family protein [bacterium AH-315-G05]PHS36313.1 MAG: hypothetical protein COA82_01680 [Alkaliphilus sp.]